MHGNSIFYFIVLNMTNKQECVPYFVNKKTNAQIILNKFVARINIFQKIESGRGKSIFETNLIIIFKHNLLF